MGKVSKCKKKIAAKVAKVEKKCAKVSKVVVAVLTLGTIFGCMDGRQPSRSQAMENNFDKCVFIMAQKSVVSNDCISAEGGDNSTPYEMFTQTQGNDGSETVTPTFTPTVDTKPDIDVSVPVNKANAGTSGAAGGALESVVGAAADWAAGKIRGAGDKNSPAAAAVPSMATQSCPDGNCSEPGVCTDCIKSAQ